jgi:hypothetical protein
MPLAELGVTQLASDGRIIVDRYRGHSTVVTALWSQHGFDPQ